MLGATIHTPASVRGSEAGKSWKHTEIRGARPPYLDSAGKKLVLFLASIAFLLTPLVPIPVFSQVASGTLSGTVTSETGSRIPNAHLSIRNTGNGKTVSTKGKEDGSYSVSNRCQETTRLRLQLRVSLRPARP